MEKFKVGDKVKIINTDNYLDKEFYIPSCMNGLIGKTGVVKSVLDIFDRPTEYNVNGWYWLENMITLIPTFEPNKNYKVKLIDKYYNTDSFKKLSREQRKCVSSYKSETFIVKTNKEGEVDNFFGNSIGKPDFFEIIEEIEDTREKYIGKWIESKYYPKGIFKCVALSTSGKDYIIVESDDGWEYKFGAESFDRQCDTNKKYWYININWSKIVNKPKKPLRKWTSEELQMADTLIADIIMFSNPFIKTYVISDVCVKLVNTKGKSFVAHCSPEDTPNKKIGLAVALCKMTGTTIPDFIKH